VFPSVGFVAGYETPFHVSIYFKIECSPLCHLECSNATCYMTISIPPLTDQLSNQEARFQSSLYVPLWLRSERRGSCRLTSVLSG